MPIILMRFGMLELGKEGGRGEFIDRSKGVKKTDDARLSVNIYFYDVD